MTNFRNRITVCAAVVVTTLAALATAATAQTPAKRLFGSKKLPAALKPAAHGFYSKGCIQGAVAVPVDGPNHQAMRLSRNRRWGHPDLVELVLKLADDGKKVGWNGLLVGDLSQPRGGPMLTGHASHQIGLDADIWLNPMPSKRYNTKQRERISAVSMLRRRSNGKLDQRNISKKQFSRAQYNIIRTAARYKKVERVLVHPTIKRELCRMASGDKSWLQKVRPYWGHHYHMHIRIGCPPGSTGCRSQAATTPGTGCGAPLKWWFDVALAPPKPRKKSDPKPKPAKKKRELRLGDLPRACVTALKAPAPANEKVATASFQDGQAYVPSPTTINAVKATDELIIERPTVPKPRPSN